MFCDPKAKHSITKQNMLIVRVLYYDYTKYHIEKNNYVENTCLA